MPQTIEVKIPDIGDFKEVAVIDVLVKPGDRLKAEDSIITLESDKATMDVPSPSAGTVTDVKVKVGDMVSQGHGGVTAGCSSNRHRPTPRAARRAPACDAGRDGCAGTGYACRRRIALRPATQTGTR